MGLWAEMGVMEEDPPEVGHQAVDVHQLEALEVAVGAPQLEDQAVDVHQLEVLEVEVDRQAEAGLEMVPEVQVEQPVVLESRCPMCPTRDPMEAPLRSPSFSLGAKRQTMPGLPRCKCHQPLQVRRSPW